MRRRCVLAGIGPGVRGFIGSALSQPMVIGIVMGLVVGKQLGIIAAVWLVVRSGIASLPHDVGWRHMYGAAWLGGIGFTMSLFVSELAFPDGTMLEAAKLGGVLVASTIAGVGGLAILLLVNRRIAASVAA